jgi:type I restriction-modification system DNA methylase subunit
MTFHSTEITVRDVLLSELKLRNLQIAQELSMPLPSGRKAPDGILSNGSNNYVLETKLGGEADYWEDIKKLTEWMKIPAQIAGAFAVLLPKELRNVPWEVLNELAKSPKLKYDVSALFHDNRPADRKQGSLSEIAEWIAGHVLKPQEEITPDSDFVITVLSQSVNQLSIQMREMSVKQFEDIFGGRLVFDNILEIKPDKLPLDDLRRAASYLFINQILFYEVLSENDPGRFPRIDTEKLYRPSDILDYFRRVLEIDYAPTFGFDIASRLAPKANDTVKTVVDIIQAMGLARIRHDVLGKVFHNLIPLAIRKPVAAYYTNSEAGQLLAKLAVWNASDRVLDPACGSGTLLVSSYQEKRHLLQKEATYPFERNFNLKDHIRFVSEDITGVDIMPFAAHLAVVHLSIQAPRFITQRVRVAVWDSTGLKPYETIPTLARELSRAFKQPTLDLFKDGRIPEEAMQYIEKGSLTAEGIGGEGINLDPVDVVIMNPPFTSSDNLGTEYKKMLKDRFSEYSSLIQGKISFQGHFLILADSFLKEGGRIAAVLPQTTFTGEAFAPIIKLLIQKYSIKAIVAGLGRSAFSENTALSEVLFVAKKEEKTTDNYFALIGTKTSPIEWTNTQIENLVNRLRNREDSNDDYAVITWINQNELSIERGGLTRLLPRLSCVYEKLVNEIGAVFKSKIMLPYSQFEERSGIQAFMSTLGNREAPGRDGRGGVYFGTSALTICRDERRALKKVDRLILSSEDKGHLNITDKVSGVNYAVPKSAIVPNVRRLSLYPTFNISDSTDFLISKPFVNLENIIKNIYGEQKAKVYLQRIKERWTDRVKHGSTQLCLARRIDLAASGTFHLGVYTSKPSFTGHGGWGFRNITDKQSKLLCLWFNSSLFIMQLLEQRTQTRGTWMRFDKHRYARTLIPDITALSTKEQDKLLEVYDELEQTEFPSLIEQFRTSFEGRKDIDSAWLEVMGIDSNNLSKVLGLLHEYIYDTLNTLRGAMSKD